MGRLPVVVLFFINVLLSVAFLCDGRLQLLLEHVAMYLPLLVIAIKLGNYLHHKLNDQHLRLSVYSLLMVVGLLMKNMHELMQCSLHSLGANVQLSAYLRIQLIFSGGLFWV